MDLNSFSIIFGIVGGIVTICSAFWAIYAHHKSSSMSRLLTESQGKIAGLQQQLHSALQPVTRQAARLEKLNEEMADANRLMVDAIKKSQDLDMSGLPLQSFSVGNVPWRVYNERAIVVSVISGKGGVGKSLLSVGLANHLAKEGPVLLVDFDLHNRGLTCRYRGGIKGDADSLMGWISRYQALNQPDAEIKHVLERESFVQIRDDFLYEDKKNQRPFETRIDLLSRKLDHRLWFLPSRSVEQPFLASDQSQLHAVDVAQLIQIIALFARRHDCGRYVILDCHGGHDMFMAGAIAASDMVITVLKPELGGLEGAQELVKISKKLVQDDLYLPITSAAVINECQEATEELVSPIEDALKQDGVPVFRVARCDSIGSPSFEPSSSLLNEIESLRTTIESLSDLATGVLNQVRHGKFELELKGKPTKSLDGDGRFLSSNSDLRAVGGAGKYGNYPESLLNMAHHVALVFENAPERLTEKKQSEISLGCFEVRGFGPNGTTFFVVTKGTKMDAIIQRFFSGVDLGRVIRKCTRSAVVASDGSLLFTGLVV